MNKKVLINAVIMVTLCTASGISMAAQTVTRQIGNNLYVFQCPNSCVSNGNGGYVDSEDGMIRLTIYRNVTHAQ